MLEVKCITSVETLHGISQQWDQLLKQSLYNSYSLSWSWVSHWINAFLDNGSQLLCLVVYEKKNLVGIGPFWIETKQQGLLGKVKILRFLGAGEVCSDHLDLIIHRKYSENICTAIWGHLYGALKDCWDIWEYNYVPVDSPILQIFRKLSDDDNRCIGFKINDYSVCPYIHLPTTWEAYLSSLSVNQRRALKVSTKYLTETGKIDLNFCKNKQDLPKFMDTHIQLHRNSWQERGKKGSYQTEKFTGFHRNFMEEQLDAGKLFLCNLELNNIPVGSFYGFIYNKTLYYYLIGVNRSIAPKASIGRVLIALCIEEAVKQGVTKFDFLRGDEKYKYDWTGLEQRELLIAFYNRSAGALFFIFRQFIRVFYRQVGYVVLKNSVQIFKKMLNKK